MKYRNENEIRFFGIRHSGNHALGFWIRALFTGKTLYLNNKRFGDDPFGKRGDKDRVPFKECVLTSYENKDINLLSEYEVPPNRDKVMGRSKRRIDMLILRDVYNTVASTIVVSGVRGLTPLSEWLPELYDAKDASTISAKNYSKIDDIFKLWIIYAKEFLGETNYLGKDKIFINFNSWFTKRSYRDKLASKLGRENKDKTINTMAKVLKKTPSGFDSLKDYEGRAQEMKLLERWKYYQKNNVYWDLFKRYPEVVMLSRKIFGDVLGDCGYGSKRQMHQLYT